MCRFCSESHDQMEPNDNQEQLGLSGEDHVTSSTSYAMNPEQGSLPKDPSSTLESPLPGPTKSLTSCESFASISSKILSLIHMK